MKTPQRLIAIGDIHGCFDQLKTLIEKEIVLQRTDRLVFLGDYIDRGSQSKEVLDYILHLKNKDFDLVTLMGNHEELLLDAFRDDSNIPIWLFNGGWETLKSFHLNSTIGLADKYVQFFNELVYYYRHYNYLFVHAGFNNQIANPFEDTYQMLWSRSDHYTHPIFKGITIVHGHTPIPVKLCQSFIAQSNKVVNLDTGCVYKETPGFGKLTAWDVFSTSVFSV